MKLFIDTWGWLNLRDRREMRHEEAKNFYYSFRRQSGKVFTTDYVLDETFTLIFNRLPLLQAHESLVMLDEAIKEGYLWLEWITPERFEQAKRLRIKFQDKPRITFTDLTSIVVMNELGITDILTEDAHFTQVGIGVRIIP